MSDAKFAVGDWVRWHRIDGLRIGEVRYVQTQRNYPWGWELVTDSGVVAEDEVLEVRRDEQAARRPPSREASA